MREWIETRRPTQSPQAQQRLPRLTMREWIETLAYRRQRAPDLVSRVLRCGSGLKHVAVRFADGAVASPASYDAGVD